MMLDWKERSPIGLEQAVARFKLALPGWYYSLCECQVSCDATCAPTTESADIHLIDMAGDPFDSGFRAYLDQPSSLAEALMDVMNQALAEKALRTGGVMAPETVGPDRADSQSQEVGDRKRSEPSPPTHPLDGGGL